jgi:hypothetical protein
MLNKPDWMKAGAVSLITQYHQSCKESRAEPTDGQFFCFPKHHFIFLEADVSFSMAACSPAFPPAVFKIYEKKNSSIKTASVQSGLGSKNLIFIPCC